MLAGYKDHWQTLASTEAGYPDVLWDRGDFGASGNADESEHYMALRGDLTVPVDLSAIRVGATFTIRTVTFARAKDHKGATSGAFAEIREPQGFGGMVQHSSGLTQIGSPQLEPPAYEPPAPVCPTGPIPAAGTLQFNSSGYVSGEGSGDTPQVLVTRTGGMSGPASATIITSDGTAEDGPDYTQVTTTVTFADGDASPRLVRIPVVQDEIYEDVETFNLALVDPDCANLGVSSNAVMTIVDDDPEPGYTIGGTVTGLEAAGLVLSQLGEQITPGNGPFEFTEVLPDGFPYDVTVTTQPVDPAQICTVTDGQGTVTGANVTDVTVDCVTATPDTDLDPTFGDGGRVTTPGIDDGQAIVVQPDGKIVAVGDDTLARYDTDGTLDETFGEDGTGIIITDLDDDSCFVDGASDVALQSDSHIVVVGIADDGGPENENFGMRRYDANGVLDTGFGDAGLVSDDFAGDSDCAYGVAIQPDDKIVVAGETIQGGNGDVGVVRYNADGTPDTSFGSDGTGLVTTDIGGDLDLATDVTIDTHDNVVLVARVSAASSLGNFSVVRYSPAGLLDSSFDGDGITGFDPGTAGGLAIDIEGRIVVAGSFQSGFVSGKQDFAVWRFLANGERDASFSDDGFVATDFADVIGPASTDDFGADLALQPDGKIVVVGRGASDGSGDDLAMTRYGTDGTLDASFGSNGTLTADFAGGFDFGHDVAIQPDGKIVASATADTGSNSELGLVRINN